MIFSANLLILQPHEQKMVENCKSPSAEKCLPSDFKSNTSPKMKPQVLDLPVEVREEPLVSSNADEKENYVENISLNKDLDYECKSDQNFPLVEIHKNVSAPPELVKAIKIEENELEKAESMPKPDVVIEKEAEEVQEIEKVKQEETADPQESLLILDPKIQENGEKVLASIDDSFINKEVTKGIEKKYLVFRPYIDPMNVKPYKPSDRGYYFKMHNCDIRIIRYTLEDNGFRDARANSLDWTLLWYCTTIKSQVYQGLNKYQKVNHFPKSNELTRKDLISENMNRMGTLHGETHYDFYPKTFNLPKEHSILVEEMESNPSQWWIVKPAASAQGRGIFF